jgi:hypothetical protein
MTENLRIELRQKQLYLNQDVNQPIVVECGDNGSTRYVPGVVDHSWRDVTQDTDGLDKFKLSWTATTTTYSKGNEGDDTNTYGSNYQKGVTAELVFSGLAFQFIFDFLMTLPCQSLNSIEARIFDVDCGKYYRLFEIKLDNTEYRPFDEECMVSMALREVDNAIHVFDKTILEDDWQGWYNSNTVGTKDHPTFMFVVEKKPKLILAIYMVVAYIAGILSLGILVNTSDGRIWIRRMMGVCYFCPSPLIREMLKNICDKYGFTMNTIFDDKAENQYRDTCLFFPVLASYSEFETFNSISTKYLWDNRTGKPVTTFLNELRSVFNAEWYVTPNNELVFQGAAYFRDQTPVYDFSAPDAVRVYDLTYTFNGGKKPAYGSYNYQIDPQDTCSNELKWRYNDRVDFDGPADNPMLEGNVTKTFEFACTSFMYDGSKPDFIEEAIRIGRIIGSAAVLAGMLTLFGLASNPFVVVGVLAALSAGYGITNGWMNDFFQNENLRNAVRIASNEINTPRLILWDRNTPLNQAKAVTVTDPAINPYYNLNNKDYYAEHHAQDLPGFAEGVTQVANYPMFVDANYFGNLYDRFHEIDNPLNNADINQEWSLVVEKCCEMMDILGVWENDFIKIGAVVILENRKGRLIKGRIEDVDIDEDNKEITIKGKVLK